MIRRSSTGAFSAGGIYATGAYDVAITADILGIDPDDSAYTMCAAVFPAGLNARRYCNPAVDAAENDALTHYDRATRKRDYARHPALDRARRPVHRALVREDVR